MFVYKHVTFKHTKPEIKDIFNHTLSIIVNLGRLFVIFMGIFTCQLTICYQCIISLQLKVSVLMFSGGREKVHLKGMCEV